MVKRLSIAIAAAIAIAASMSAAVAQQVPVLFNDQHVYTKPDALTSGRVLAALVRGGTILVPLRAMFEQMGATVAYDAATRTAIVSKPSSEVRLTVGRPEIAINGETRPLDVPPEIYHGVVLVPIRVISEAMGAYVQWIPDKRIVVVRYASAAAPAPPAAAPAVPLETPAPTAPPIPEPTAASIASPPPSVPEPPLPTQTPTPLRRHYESFIVGDYIGSPSVYNQFSSGTNTQVWGPSYAGRAAVEFPLAHLSFMVEGYAEQYAYTHPGGSGVPQNTSCNVPGLAGNPACVRPIGPGTASFWVRQFQAIDGDASARVGVQVANPRIYIAGAYLWTSNNYGYPRMSGAGVGIEKLPDLDRTFSYFGSFYYYPQVQGAFTDPTSGTPFEVQYRFIQYQVGVTYNIPIKSKYTGLFFEGGFMGNASSNKQFLPGNAQEAGGFAGAGLHF